MNLFRLIFILTTSIIATHQTYAQTYTQTIKGTVTDMDTGAPLIGAHIVVLGYEKTKGAITDGRGEFRIEEVAIGRASFKIGYVGYEDYVASEITIGSAKELNLNIRLRESIVQMEAVTVLAKKDNTTTNNEVAVISARSFSVEETKRFPASISDPGRMAQSYAGVTTSDDQTNEIIIRGNAPNQLLWRIEGVEVPSPNHFAEEGFSSGAISILNTNMLERSDFFTGAFPAEYGNAISGVFDINLRNGNNQEHEYAFQLGVLGTDITAEGPFSKGYKGSYLVNYRYSTLSLIENIVDIADGSIPTYQDFSFKTNLPLGQRTVLSIWGIGGYSEDNSDGTSDDQFEYDEIFESKTYMGAITLKKFFQDNSRLEVRLSTAENASDYISNSTELFTGIFESDSDLLRNQAHRLNLSYFKKINAKTSFKLGTIGSIIQYDVESKFTENGVETIAVDDDGNGEMGQGYLQIKHRFNEELFVVAGTHMTYFSLNENTAIEPRMGLEWKINSKHTLSAGFGIHSRVYPLNQYFIKAEDDQGVIRTPNLNLDLMSATHYVIGYDWRLIKNGHFKVEAYLQQLNKLAVVKNDRYTDAVVNGRYLGEALTDRGIGINKGIDITFEKFFSEQYYFLISSSFYDSKYRASNNQWYNTSFNYGFTFNAVGGKEYTVGKEGNNTLGASIKIISNGGKRATPIDQDYLDLTGELRFDQFRRNSLRLGAYFRSDISVYYRINKSKASHVISLDVQNFTDNQNPGGQYIDNEKGQVATYYQLGLLPILNYKIEF